jgi:hypothetical protein
MNAEVGRRGRNRTCNPRIRNPMLYPFELRAPGNDPMLSHSSLDPVLFRAPQLPDTTSLL